MGPSSARKRDAIAAERRRLDTTLIGPRLIPEAAAERVIGQSLEREYALTDLLRRPGVTYAALHTLRGAGVPVADERVAEQVEVTIKYAGYIDRQHDEMARQLAQEALVIPAGLDYDDVRGLSTEARQKLAAGRPETIGQAARISGITPAAIALLLVHLKRAREARVHVERKSA